MVERGQTTKSFMVFKKDFDSGTRHEIKLFDLRGERKIDLELNTKFKGKIGHFIHKQKSILDAEDFDIADDIPIADKFSVIGFDSGSYEFVYGDKQCQICAKKFIGKKARQTP